MATPDVTIAFALRDDVTPGIKTLESSIIRFVGAIASAMAALNVVGFPIKAASEFQAELLNVQKTTGFSTAEIGALSQELRTLSERVDVSAVDLAKIAAVAGQLGLKGSVAEIAAFTDSVSRMSSVLNVSVDDAANGIARLSSIFNLPVAQAEKLVSALNEVSNNSTATGEDLIDIVQRIGTATDTITAEMSIALAAYGKDLGLTNEVIGTSFNKIFLDLQTQAPVVAELLGITTDEWITRLKTDGIGALKEFATYVLRIPEASRAAFVETTIGGGRLAGLMTKIVNDAANDFSLLDKEIASATVGFNEGTSALREQETVLKGLGKQFQILKNTATNVFEKIGTENIAYVTELVQQLKEYMQSADFADGAKALVGVFFELGKMVIDLLKHLASIATVLQPLVPVITLFLKLTLLKTVLITLANLFTGILNPVRQVATTLSLWSTVLSGNKNAIAQLSLGYDTLMKRAQDARNNLDIAGATRIEQAIPAVAKYAASLHKAEVATQNMAAAQTAVTAASAKVTQQAAINAALQQRYTDRIADANKRLAAAQEKAANKQGLYTKGQVAWAQKAIPLIQQEIAMYGQQEQRFQAAASRRIAVYRQLETAARNEVASQQAANTAMVRQLGVAGTAVGGVWQKVTTGATAAGNAATTMFGKIKTGLVGFASGAASVLGFLGRIGSILLSGLGIGFFIAMVLQAVGLLDPLIQKIKEFGYWLGVIEPDALKEARIEADRAREEFVRLNGAVEEYRRKIASADFKTPTVGQGGAAGLAKEVQEAVTFMKQADEAARGFTGQLAEAEVASRYVQRQAEAIAVKIREATQEVAKYKREAAGADPGSTEQAAALERARQAQQRLNGLLEEQRGLALAGQELFNNRVSLTKELLGAEQNRLAMAEQIAGVYTDEAVDLANITLRYKEASAELEKQQKIIEDIRTKQNNKETLTTVDYASLVKAEAEVARLGALQRAAANDFEQTWQGSSYKVQRSFSLLFGDLGAMSQEQAKAAVEAIEIVFGSTPEKAKEKIANLDATIAETETKLSAMKRVYETKTNDSWLDDLNLSTKQFFMSLEETEAQVTELERTLATAQGTKRYVETLQKAAEEGGAKFRAGMGKALDNVEGDFRELGGTIAQWITTDKAVQAMRNLRSAVEVAVDASERKVKGLGTALSQMADDTREALRKIDNIVRDSKFEFAQQEIDFNLDTKEFEDALALERERANASAARSKQQQDEQQRLNDLEQQAIGYVTAEGEERERIIEGIRRQYEQERQRVDEIQRTAELERSQDEQRQDRARRLEQEAERVKAKALNDLAAQKASLEENERKLTDINTRLSEAAEKYAEIKAKAGADGTFTNAADAENAARLAYQINGLSDEVSKLTKDSKDTSVAMAELTQKTTVITAQGPVKIFTPEQVQVARDMIARIDEIGQKAYVNSVQTGDSILKSMKAQIDASVSSLEQQSKTLKDSMMSQAEGLRISGEALQNLIGIVATTTPSIKAFSESIAGADNLTFKESLDGVGKLREAMQSIPQIAEDAKKSFQEQFIAKVNLAEWLDTGQVTDKIFVDVSAKAYKIAKINFDPEGQAALKAQIDGALASDPITIKPKGDASEAKTTIETVLKGITPPKVPVSIDASAAITQNSALNKTLSQPVTKKVYIQTVQQNAGGGYIENLLPKFSTGGSSPRKASGLLNGPGTGTSDSILSWLSHGEFVINAATVRKFGVGFFYALQRMARSATMPNIKLPKFATGGAVDLKSISNLPSFAAGGPTEETYVNLSINNQPAGRFVGSKDAVTQLVDTLRMYDKVTVR